MEIPSSRIKAVEEFLYLLHSENAVEDVKESTLSRLLKEILCADDAVLRIDTSAKREDASLKCNRILNISEKDVFDFRCSRKSGSKAFSCEERKLAAFLCSFINPAERHSPETETGGCKESSTPQNYGLSRRENEVVRHLLKGRSNRQIAVKLGITEATVKHHLYNIYNKTGIDSRTHLMYLVSGDSDSNVYKG